jgi:hypothetical protein
MKRLIPMRHHQLQNCMPIHHHQQFNNTNCHLNILSLYIHRPSSIQSPFALHHLLTVGQGQNMPFDQDSADSTVSASKQSSNTDRQQSAISRTNSQASSASTIANGIWFGPAPKHVQCFNDAFELHSSTNNNTSHKLLENLQVFIGQDATVYKSKLNDLTRYNIQKYNHFAHYCFCFQSVLDCLN